MGQALQIGDAGGEYAEDLVCFRAGVSDEDEWRRLVETGVCTDELRDSLDPTDPADVEEKWLLWEAGYLR